MYTRLPVVIDYEIRQKSEEGCDVGSIKRRFHDWLSRKGCRPREVFYALKDGGLSWDDADEPKLAKLYEELMRLGKGMDEIQGFDDIVKRMNVQPNDRFDVNDDELYDKIYGGWLGRAAGCTLGKPVELWPGERIVSYLQLADAYPLSDYIPELKPMPEGYVFKREFVGATKGDIAKAPRDDDMDYPILNLSVVEKYGVHFTTDQVGEEWLNHFPYHMVYTAERVAYKNLVNGLKVPEVSRYRNPYREWIGAQIRADLWGWINPGRPIEATEMAYRDGRLSHDENGLFGELWVAAMVALAFSKEDIQTVVRESMNYIPDDSRLFEVIKKVLHWHSRYDQWGDCFTQIRKHYGHYHKVHTLNNAAVVCMALLYSEGEFEKGITTAVNAGWDTDCNGATVGSILGVMSGAKSLPDKWIAPFHDKISSLVLSERETLLSSLAERTFEIANRIK